MELYEACESGNWDEVRNYLQPGDMTEIHFRHYQSRHLPLHVALQHDDIPMDVLERLVTPFTVNAMDGEEMPALHSLLRQLEPNYEIINYLLKNGASPDLYNGHLETALNVAAGNCEDPHIPEDVFSQLITPRNVNVQNEYGTTPLIAVINCGRFDLVDVLLSQGADINIEDKNECSPLHHSIQHINSACDQDDIIKLCSKKTILKGDENGFTVFRQAISHLDIFNILLDLGAESSLQDVISYLSSIGSYGNLVEQLVRVLRSDDCIYSLNISVIPGLNQTVNLEINGTKLDIHREEVNLKMTLYLLQRTCIFKQQDFYFTNGVDDNNDGQLFEFLIQKQREFEQMIAQPRTLAFLCTLACRRTLRNKSNSVFDSLKECNLTEQALSLITNRNVFEGLKEIFAQSQ